MIGLLVLFFVASFASFEEWSAFKSEHNKFYETVEEQTKEPISSKRILSLSNPTTLMSVDLPSQ